jgi:membrane protein
MAVLGRAQATAERAQQSGLGRFIAKYGRDQSDDYAALIAFTALFSLFPLVGAVLTLLGFVLRDPARLETARATIGQLFPGQVSDLLGFLQETRDISGPLGLVSLVGLFWSGSAIFGSMAKAFNVFYGLPERGFIGQRVMAFVMIFVFLILIVVSVTAASAATFLLGYSVELLPIPLPPLGPLQIVLGWGISFASAFLLFLALYRVVPNGPLTLGGVWRGALLGAVLFVVLSQLFPVYLRFLGGGFAAYKTLGLFLLLMTWFYFLARVVVLGCQLNAFLNPLPSPATVPAESAAVRQQPSGADAPSFKKRLADLACLAGLLVILTLVGRPRADT